jgi:hypothetical protein
MKGDAGGQISEDTKGALAAFGLVHVGDVPDRSIPVWPENWQTVEVFVAMGTQWNVSAGMGGSRLIGLRYESLPAVMRYCGVQTPARADVFAGLRTMERAALEVANGR